MSSKISTHSVIEYLKVRSSAVSQSGQPVNSDHLSALLDQTDKLFMARIAEQLTGQPLSQPLSQQVSQPLSQQVSQQVSQPLSQPVTQLNMQPNMQQNTPHTTHASQPVGQLATQSVSQSATQPATQLNTQPNTSHMLHMVHSEHPNHSIENTTLSSAHVVNQLVNLSNKVLQSENNNQLAEMAESFVEHLTGQLAGQLVNILPSQ
jgi:hypothetical protein